MDTLVEMLPGKVINTENIAKLAHPPDWLTQGERSSREAVYKHEVLSDCLVAARLSIRLLMLTAPPVCMSAL